MQFPAAMMHARGWLAGWMHVVSYCIGLAAAVLSSSSRPRKGCTAKRVLVPQPNSIPSKITKQMAPIMKRPNCSIALVLDAPVASRMGLEELVQ